MRLILTTDLFVYKKFAMTVDQFDPTFSMRYLDKDEEFPTLNGESHWEADKYNLFFVECVDGNTEKFVETFRSNDQCKIIAEADQDYNMIGEKALFVNQSDADLYTKIYKTDYQVPQNIQIRPKSFVPKPVV